MTAQELDYHEVFQELIAADETTAERLLDVATVIVGRERRIMELMQNESWGKPELGRLMNLQKVAAIEIRLLHGRLVEVEEKERAYASEVLQNSSASSSHPLTESL